MKDQFKGLDWFGQSIQLTYKGEDSYKTLLGASVSFFLIVVLLGFSIFKAYYLFSRFNPEVSKVSLLRDMSDGEIFQPQDSGFDFAFGLNSELDPRIGYFTVRQLGLYETEEKDSSGKNIKRKTKDDIPFTKCGESNFDFPDEAEIISKGISNYNCITTSNYQFQGNFYQDKFEYLEIKLWKCIDPVNATTAQKKCLDRATIDKFFDTETFNFAFVNTFFDLTEFEKGKQIKPFIDDSLFFELESNRIKKTNFYIQLQEAELEDDLIQFGQTQEIEFHQVSNQRYYDDQYSDTDGYIAAIYMRFDNRYDIYARKVYSILELLGDIGGLQGSLLAIGFIFVGFISSRMFMSDIMRKIYQVRKYVLEPEGKKLQKQESNKNITKTTNNDLKTIQPLSPRNVNKTYQEDYTSFAYSINNINNNVTPPSHSRNVSYIDKDGIMATNRPFKNDTEKDQQAVDNLSITVKIEDSSQQQEIINQNSSISAIYQDELDIKNQEEQSAVAFRKKKKVYDDDVNSLLVSFISRMRFNYNLKAIFQYITQCLCIRDLSRRRNKRYYKRHYLYKKGEEKLGQELDVIQLLKTQRKFRMLSQAMLSQKHRMLLRFQRQNLLETASESSDSDDNNLDTLHLMENKNPLIRLVIYGKLKKMMKAFEGKKLKMIERNLMRGVFQRKLKDFQEEQQDQNENKTLLQRLHGQLIESKSKMENIKIFEQDHMKNQNYIDSSKSSDSKSIEEDLEEMRKKGILFSEDFDNQVLENETHKDDFRSQPQKSQLKQFQFSPKLKDKGN
ncbi:UNKNOWN [Stylonychia lemnae]|uniref:Accessory gland protein n=1 Tax=Stylonychia lemnae TaxID=5949 RepID=A0A078B7P7_STYLE|nr:UNKNOWN [Stylonychia lemnae]|eukprot:CDW90251.1 UNKNOWN [Stylonychia lemnae]